MRAHHDRVLGDRRPPVARSRRRRPAPSRGRRSADGRPRPTRTTSAISWPWAPAFIQTAPPSVAGIATPNSSPAQPVPQRDAGQRRQRHRAAGREPAPVAGAPPVAAAEPQHEPGEPVIGDEHVRPLAEDDDTGPPSRRRRGRRPPRSRLGLGLEVQRRRPADPERRSGASGNARAQRGRRAASRRIRRGARPRRSVTPPPGSARAPRRRASRRRRSPSSATRSPARTSRSRNRTTSARCGRYTMRVPRRGLGDAVDDELAGHAGDRLLRRRRRRR